MGKNIKYLFIVLAIVIVVLFIVLANTFGFYEYLKIGSNKNTIKSANIVLEINDKTSLEISNENSYPVTDEMGRSFVPYEFSVNNIGANSTYKVKLVKDNKVIEKDGCSNNLIPDERIRFQLIKDGSIVKEDLLSNLNDYVIEDTSINSKTTVDYELRVWIDKDAGIEVMNKHFHGKIEIVVG